MPEYSTVIAISYCIIAVTSPFYLKILSKHLSLPTGRTGLD